MSVVFSADGNVADWSGSHEIKKIVVGTPPTRFGSATPIELTTQLPEDFSELYPALTHLYLWQISNLTELPKLPAGLRCLDVRGCGELKRIAELPPALETLVLEGASNLLTLPLPEALFDNLRDLSLKECTGLSAQVFPSLLERCPALQRLDLSKTLVDGLLQFWPSELRDLRLNDCHSLRRIKQAWPECLKHLELRGAKRLDSIPPFPKDLDYLDLAFTESLRQLPAFPQDSSSDQIAVPLVPRTLFLFQTGIRLDRDLYGEQDTNGEIKNVSDRVRADLQASAEGRLSDCELKVILLGNGRCGKSSLARVWVDGVAAFKATERTTHGVRLWKKTIDFTPQDYPSLKDDDDGKAHLHIWDFAGQDVYHSTHQLFLQSRAIFLICHNDHFECPGADPETDKSERLKRVEEGVDIPRTLDYWREQVAALGNVPGTTTKPPVLIVRTKTDRWTGEKQPGEICFSAKTGAGLKEIADWVEQQVSILLGTWEQRSLPKSVVEVKKKLLAKIEANDSYYWEAENSAAASGTTEHPENQNSPHPHLEMKTFENIVQECCKGDYKNSTLLLERFHRRGFIYYDQRFLPNYVILDQRWALSGIYTFCSRDSKYQIRQILKEKNGVFTKSLLKKESWGPAGYDDKAMDLFLKFMVACGMCFEILSAQDTTANEAVYAIPGFFPSRTSAVSTYPQIDDQSGSHQRYLVENVSESDIRAVISRFGRDWRRSMYAWQWGCRIWSAASDAVCFIDWHVPECDARYRHPLTIRFFGPDEPEFRGLVNRYLAEILHKPVGLPDTPTTAPWVTEAVLRKESMPPRGGTDEKSEPGTNDHRNHVPDAVKAKGVSVALSFAGADPEKCPTLADIPLTVAKLLDTRLRQANQGVVLCYKFYEDPSQEMPQEERMLQFTQDLARGDIILVFWSEKYWDSENCMSEMMLIYKRIPAGRLLDKEVVTYVFEGGRFSKTSGVDVNKWDRKWEVKAQERDEEVRALYNGRLRDVNAALKRDGIVNDWYDFVANRTEFEQFLVALKHYRLSTPLQIPRSAEEANNAAAEIVDFVMSLLRDPLVLIEQAIQTFQGGQIEHAVMFLRRAFQLTPDNNQGFFAFLTGSNGDKIPTELRDAALEYFSQRELQ